MKTDMLYFSMRKYILTFIPVFFVSCLLIAPCVYGNERADHDCTKCHQITNDEALNVLKKDIGIPDVRVIGVRPGPLKGLWEIAFEAESRKGIGYLDFSKQKIIFGSILQIKTKTNLTGERLYELNKVDISKIPLDEALVMGDKDAQKKVVVFTDPD